MLLDGEVQLINMTPSVRSKPLVILLSFHISISHPAACPRGEARRWKRESGSGRLEGKVRRERGTVGMGGCILGNGPAKSQHTQPRLLRCLGYC